MPDRVLLVLARDAGLASALRRLLGREGFPVRTGHHGLEGLISRYPGEHITAVLVDAGLLADAPADQLARLRAGYPGALVLVMAGRPHHPVLRAAVAEGALPLTADFELDELVQVLSGDDDGLGGVREPRRPRPPTGSAAVALQPPVG